MPNENDGSSSDEGSCSGDGDPGSTIQRNLINESAYCAFTGIFMGMAFFASPVIAVTCLDVSAVELTIIVSAFPCGAFLGPVWAALGRRWGMQKLVTRMAVWATLPLFLMPWVETSTAFTIIVTVTQLLYSAMRMGQSSLYRVSYPKNELGRAIGRLTFATFVTMVPTVLIAGIVSDADHDPTSYRWLYPLAGLAGLIGSRFYARLRPVGRNVAVSDSLSVRASLRGIHQVVRSDRGFMLFQIAFFLSGSAYFMSSHVTILLTHQRLGFTASDLAIWLSVVPQLILAFSSLMWGRVLDRIGIVRLRWLISVMMTTYLTCYFTGIASGTVWLIFVGSFLRGMSEGGGQVTWALASVHFAPRPEDVHLYSGIHFALNGVRGLVMPSIGSTLAVLTGQWTLLVATAVSGAAIFVLSRTVRLHPESGEVEGPVPVPGAMPRPALEEAADVARV